MTTFYTHICQNCEVWCDSAWCSPCSYLQTCDKYAGQRTWQGDTQGTVNRRWQMRFNRGELDRSITCNAGVLWETKRKDQTW